METNSLIEFIFLGALELFIFAAILVYFYQLQTGKKMLMRVGSGQIAFPLRVIRGKDRWIKGLLDILILIIFFIVLGNQLNNLYYRLTNAADQKYLLNKVQNSQIILPTRRP